MNTGESFAVISDIHGNSAALSAVLADMAARQISRAFNLGDTLYGPLDPQGACRMLRASPVVFTHIRGNGARLLFEDPSGFNPTARHTLAALDGASLDWLGGHAPLFNEGRVMACHGPPGQDDEYLLEAIATRAAGVKTPEALSAPLPRPRPAAGPPRYSLGSCCHTHIPPLPVITS